MADFDVIVVGSGMSGGWVAKEMAERGFKVGVIERGRDTKPEVDFTDMVEPWEIPYLNRKTDEDRRDKPIQSTVYNYDQLTKHYWVSDIDHPYDVPDGQRYVWRRGYQKGGRSIMWGRQSYRMSEIDFEANKKDGHGVDWPVRYKDLKPWYDYVERFAGISGSKEGLDILPDGVFQPAHDLTCGEQVFKEAIEKNFPTRTLIPGRVANLTQPTKEQNDLGRGKCQARNICARGCSFGAMFSSVAATLPAADRTGNYTLIPDTAVHKVLYDPATQRATGVETVNIKTNEAKTITARVIFLNAGTIPSTMILLNSATDGFENGLANSSGVLGHYLMDHTTAGSGNAILPGHEDKYVYGRRPNGFYIPRFHNHTEGENEDGSVRGFGYQGRVMRDSWRGTVNGPGIGKALKEQTHVPGPWVLSMTAFMEVLPDIRNNISLHKTKTDKWGFPIPILDAKARENELKLAKAATRATREMMEAAGFIHISVADPNKLTVDDLSPPGNGIHEMGTARMGLDPKTSVLNKWNQSWDVPNLFVTDGSFMTSGGCQNPSLSYMAFSARAANHAADLMQAGKL